MPRLSTKLAASRSTARSYTIGLSYWYAWWLDWYSPPADAANGGLVAIRLGVLGLGSVFWTPYRSLISRLVEQGRVEVTAAYDPDPAKREALSRVIPSADADIGSAEELVERDDVDVVVVLTSMNEHGSLAQAALRAGKHVLVEKPMATTLEEAAALVELSKTSPGLLVCAPHIVLSPTYREMHRRVRDG